MAPCGHTYTTSFLKEEEGNDKGERAGELRGLQVRLAGGFGRPFLNFLSMAEVSSLNEESDEDPESEDEKEETISSHPVKTLKAKKKKKKEIMAACDCDTPLG